MSGKTEEMPEGMVITRQVIDLIVKPYIARSQARGRSYPACISSLIAGIVDALVPMLVTLDKAGREKLITAIGVQLTLATNDFGDHLDGREYDNVIPFPQGVQ